MQRLDLYASPLGDAELAATRERGTQRGVSPKKGCFNATAAQAPGRQEQQQMVETWATSGGCCAGDGTTSPKKALLPGQTYSEDDSRHPAVVNCSHVRLLPLERPELVVAEEAALDKQQQLAAKHQWEGEAARLQVPLADQPLRPRVRHLGRPTKSSITASETCAYKSRCFRRPCIEAAHSAGAAPSTTSAAPGLPSLMANLTGTAAKLPAAADSPFLRVSRPSGGASVQPATAVHTAAPLPQNALFSANGPFRGVAHRRRHFSSSPLMGIATAPFPSSKNTATQLAAGCHRVSAGPPLRCESPKSSSPAAAAGALSIAPAAAGPIGSAESASQAETHPSSQTPGGRHGLSSLFPGRSVITRRQRVAAALAEVVRVEDSSDEEAPHAAQARLAINNEVLSKGCQAAMEERCLGPSGPHRGSGVILQHAPTGCLVLAAALVDASGHCCVLNGATVLRTTAERKKWLLQQQKHPSGSSAAATPEAAGALAALASGAGGNEIAAKTVLVMQVHDEEGLLSLDLWSPEASASSVQCSEGGDTERPSSPPGDRKGSFCNLCRFACRSVCGLKMLSVRGPSRSASSMESSTGSGDRCRCSTREDLDALPSAELTCNNSSCFRKERTKEIKGSPLEGAGSCAGQSLAAPFSGALPPAEAAGRAVPVAAKHVSGHRTPGSVAGFKRDAEVNAAEATDSQGACSPSACCAQPSEAEALRKGCKVHSSRGSHGKSGGRRKNSGKSCSRGRRSHKRNGGGDDTEDDCLSGEKGLTTEALAIAGSSSPCTGPSRTLSVPTSHRKERRQGAFTPRNALLVTDGKPAHGTPFSPGEKMAIDAALGVATFRDNTTSKKRKVEDLIEMQLGGQERSISNKPHRPSIAKGAATDKPEEFRVHLNRPADNARKRSSRKGTGRKRGSRKQRSSYKSQDDAVQDSNVRSNSWCKQTSGDEALGAASAVSILCIQLQETRAGEVQCSKMLRKCLRGSSKVSSSAARSNRHERLTAGDAEVAAPNSLSAPPDPQPVTVQENSCKYMASVNARSSTTSATSISGRECRQRHHCSGERLESEGHTETKRSSSGRRHHSARSSRRSLNPSSSRTSRRSRSGAPSSPVPASSDAREPFDLLISGNAATGLQEKFTDNSTSCRLAVSCASHSITATADKQAESRRVQAQNRTCSGNAPGALSISTVPVPGLTGSELTAPQRKIREESVPSQGLLRLPHRRDLWLLLRFGSTLNSASSAEEADVTAPVETHQTSPFPLPDSLRVAGSSGSSNSLLQGQDGATLSESKQEPLDSVHPFASFVGAFTRLPLTFWPGEGRSADVSAAAKFLASFSDGQIGGDRGLEATSAFTQDYGLQKDSHRIEAVLQCLVLKTSGPWSAVGDGGDGTRNVSLDRLRLLWKASVGACQRMGSVPKPLSEALLPLLPAPPPPITSDEGAKATRANASRASTAASPICDLLLDDKTLRRLTDKDFLDDTIIDFGLQFILDHVLTAADRLRVHISNTFFLSALMGEQSEEAAHARLTRWLKKEVTPLPSKDIIFIPIHHQHQHWSLAVVVYPWRAVNSSVRQTGGAVAVARPSSQLVGKTQPLGTVQAHGVKAAPSPLLLTEGFVGSPSVANIPQSAAAKCFKASWIPPLRPTKSNFHLHKDSHSKARMFHVDSMGLRAEFDRCRGRLKRFLQRVRKRHEATSQGSEFELRCRGTLESGERAEFCTESCCWQDGLSCNLHTPRQKNGYDCGVFVLEFVLFLTRNLEAIETLLDGPARYPPIRQRQRLLGVSPSPAVPEDSRGSLEGRRGDELCSAHDNSGELLRAALGFSCPCMAAKGPMTAPCGAAMWSVYVKEQQQASSRLPPIDGSPGESARRVCLSAREPRELSCRFPVSPQDSHSSQENVASARALPQGDAEGEQQISSVEVPLGTDSGGAPCLASPGASGSEATTRCPIWGPLRASASKRHSAHTKWFSQARVTQRRSRLHQMLLFMRENVYWQEHPQQIAHLRSLLLNGEGPV